MPLLQNVFIDVQDDQFCQYTEENT